MVDAGPVASRIRLVCLDLDGTLCDSGKNVSRGNRAALARAREAGLAVAVASGRHPFNVCALMDDLGLPHTAVCLSGAYVMLDGHEVFRHGISLECAERAVEVARRAGCYISVSGADFNLNSGTVTRAASETEATSRYQGCGGYDELLGEVRTRSGELLKCALHTEDDESYQGLRVLLASALPEATLAQSDVCWMDVTDAGCSKAEGISALARAMGLSLSEVAAVGDDENDVESMGVVGLGIAMGNAIEPVRAAADMLVADNEHDGVAEAIDAILAAREGRAS